MKTQFFLIVFVSFFILQTHASDASDAQVTLTPVTSEGIRNPAQADREVIEKAKLKGYRGGGEEGELRVQPVLVKAQRKIVPAVDRAEAEKENQEHD